MNRRDSILERKNKTRKQKEAGIGSPGQSGFF